MSSESGGQPGQEWPPQQPEYPPPQQLQHPPQQWQFRPPGPTLEAIGAGCLGLWAIGSLVATFVAQPGNVTYSIEHHACQQPGTVDAFSTSCSRVDGFYTLAAIAFWIAVILLGWPVLARVVTTLASRPGGQR
jgi:hypothetical protein